MGKAEIFQFIETKIQEIMATRQEIQVGSDFARSLSISLLMLDRIDTSKPPTTDNELSSSDFSLRTFNTINAFRASADPSLEANGFLYYEIDKNLFDAGLKFIEDYKDQKDPQDPTTIIKDPVLYELPYSVRMANISNDCIDALYYELNGLNPYTGELISLDAETITTLIVKRSDVALKYANISGDSDLISASHWISQNATSAKISDIISYIETNVPKLPLLRRYWAL